MTEETLPKFPDMTQEVAAGLSELLELKVLPQVENLLTELNNHLNCKQFEIMLMDVENMMQQLQDLKLNGPKDPFVKIDFSASELAEAVEASDSYPVDQEPKFV
jgi:hypothetical protein